MSFEKLRTTIVSSAFYAYLLVTACTYELPTVNGNGGGGSGPATSSTGTGGETSASASSSSGTGGAMPADWWDPAWPRRAKISFDNANGETLTNFPLMVRLDASRMPGVMPSAKGADLRFVDDDGKTVLPHEIDQWMPGGNSFVWVLVPTIDVSTTDHIWLYYGNATAKAAQDPKTLWNGFVDVYHFAPNASMPNQAPDSTGSSPANWLSPSPGMTIQGPVGRAAQMDGMAFLEVGDNGNVAANPGQARTVEVWANAAVAQEQYIVYEEGQCVGWTLGMNSVGEFAGTFITDPIAPLCGSDTNEYAVPAPATLSTWNYLTLVVNRPASIMQLFVNGQLLAATVIDNTAVADGNGVFRIGSDWDGGPGTFIGGIDEVRVWDGARSPQWVAAQYRAMNDKFLNFAFP